MKCGLKTHLVGDVVDDVEEVPEEFGGRREGRHKREG